MPTRQIATNIIKKLVDAGFIAYFAGGWVRDFLMKLPSDDIDIATNASVSQIQELFPKTIPVGIAFGIVIVVEEGHQFEVATFRKDREYSDGRRPMGFDPASPEEDAERRDFTINGMFYDPLTETLHDFVHGQQDIQKKLIRAIGDPHERFREDRLRMMRAVRYATRFNFAIEQETQTAILAHAPDLVPAVAKERIWQEFKKMSRFAHFDTSLLMLHELNLLPTIFPQLKGISNEEIKKRVAHIEAFPKNSPTIAELIELFPHSSLDDLIELCDDLKLSREDKQFVIFYHRAFSLFNMVEEWQNQLELVEWAHFYAHPHSPLCLTLYAIHLPQKEAFLETHNQRQARLEWAIKRIQTHRPVVSADDLLKLGLKPGKHLGALLKEAERLAINHNTEDKATILKLLNLEHG